jgi:hypothetical protein
MRGFIQERGRRYWYTAGYSNIYNFSTTGTAIKVKISWECHGVAT